MSRNLPNLTVLILALAALSSAASSQDRSRSSIGSHDQLHGCSVTFATGNVRHRPAGHQAESFWVTVDFWASEGAPRSRACLAGSFGEAPAWHDGSSLVYTFFGPGNVEVVVKVLDGCSQNGHFWVYAAGLTDLRWRLEVFAERFFRPASGQETKRWYVDPGERLIPERLYQDSAANPWSPDLFRDRLTGQLYHRLDDDEVPPRTMSRAGSQQVADTQAFGCRRR